MKFYDREKEIERLMNIHGQSFENAQMTFVVGRRRIGKTMLLLRAMGQENTLYFFVARKAEELLCGDFEREIEEKLKVPILGKSRSFAQLFEFLMKLSQTQQVNIIIDEFQEFYNINPSIYSEIQHYWDLYHNGSRMNLLLCGSVFSLMCRIFENQKEPLFGRATAQMHVHPFKLDVLQHILGDFNPDYQPEDLLALYIFTGGVPKYIQLLMDNQAYTFDEMLNFIVREDSPFLNEGKNMLIGEFGKEYGLYFSILSSISEGRTSRGEIEAELNREIGGYLTRLEKDFNLIQKTIPIFSHSLTKNMRYQIADNFLSFWFRFIYKYDSFLQIGQYENLRNLIKRDYKTFSGHFLEKYFRQQLQESGSYTKIGGFWDRKGTTEIDIVALNELSKQLVFAEVKRTAEHIKINVLKEKASLLLAQFPQYADYQIEYQTLSLEDLPTGGGVFAN